MVYVVLSDLYMYHANIDFICFDSASNLGTDTNPDVNINGSQDAELPAYNDPAVISKVAEFHAELASLDPVRCSTCYEKFPTVSVNDARTCTRCHNDNHIPKLFSAANNLDPGSVPPELTVSNNVPC